MTATERGPGDRILRSLALYIAYVAIGIGLACVAVIGAMLIVFAVVAFAVHQSIVHRRAEIEEHAEPSLTKPPSRGAILLSLALSIAYAGIRGGLALGVVFAVILIPLAAFRLLEASRAVKQTPHASVVGGSRQ